MSRLMSLFLMIWPSLSLLAQSPGTPFIRNFTPEEFQGGIQSWDFMEDDSGILYVANNFGLLEFDGSTWSIHPVINGTKIRSVHVSGNGNIYVGSQADFGYFAPDARGSLRYFSLADSLPEAYRNFDEVWRIYETRGKIHFLTFDNIFAHTPGNALEIIDPGFPLEFSFLVNDDIYVLQWGHGLSALRGKELHIIPGGEFFGHRQIASVLPAGKSELLIFTIHDGIFRYNAGHISPFPTAPNTTLGSCVINQAILLKDGAMAIGTQDNGLLIIDQGGQLLMHINRDNGLLDQTIHAVYQDSQDNLWLGLNNSIALVERSSPFTLIDSNAGLSGTGYAALQAGTMLYLGTNTGLYYLDRADPAQRTFTLIPGSAGQVYQLTKIRNHLLMGHHNGPYEIKGKRVHLLGDEKGAWEFIAFPNRPDHLLMGSYNGLSLLRIEGGRIAIKKKYDGFDESSRVLEIDGQGNVWMAHGYKGIYRITFDDALQRIDSIRYYNATDGLPADHLNNMEFIGNKLIFPALRGVYNFDRELDRFVEDQQYRDLFDSDEHVIKMEEDLTGNIYFITRPRVGKISFDKFGKATVETQIFNKIRDLLNDDLGSIHIPDGESVLFGAKRGFIRYDPSKQKTLNGFHTHLRKVVNTSSERDSLLFEGRAIANGASLTLPYALNSVRFVYSATAFEDPDQTTYQYFLEKFDQGWSAWTTKAEKEYTNLPEGEYAFRVRARNVYGIEQEAPVFTFTVDPPFYRTHAAYTLYGLSGLLVLGMTFVQVNKQFKKEKRRMLLNQEREILRKNTEIRQLTTQSEQQIMRLKNDKLQAEVDHMNRELTSSTIHLINKNELLSTVKTNLEELLRKNSERPTEALKRIIHNIDQNLNSDGDWNQFELHFNNVHGNFTNKLLETYPRLTPQEIKLSAYLRLNLTTKEIANLLNISVRGVEISRYRLRKKLDLDRSENLTDFMLKF